MIMSANCKSLQSACSCSANACRSEWTKWNYRVTQIAHTGLLMMLTLCRRCFVCGCCLTFTLSDCTACAVRLSVESLGVEFMIRFLSINWLNEMIIIFFMSFTLLSCSLCSCPTRFHWFILPAKPTSALLSVSHHPPTFLDTPVQLQISNQVIASQQRGQDDLPKFKPSIRIGRKVI